MGNVPKIGIYTVQKLLSEVKNMFLKKQMSQLRVTVSFPMMKSFCSNCRLMESW